MNESFVISGSEDGNILIWYKNIGVCVERFLGYIFWMNVVVWNFLDVCMFVFCGDDEYVKM